MVEALEFFKNQRNARYKYSLIYAEMVAYQLEKALKDNDRMVKVCPLGVV